MQMIPQILNIPISKTEGDKELKFRKQYLTKNPCYIHRLRIEPSGIVIHSPAVANPSPDWLIKRWDKSSAKACTHALVTRDEVIQLLPWTHRCWGAGKGNKGSANASYIQFDVMEPSGHRYSGSKIIGYKHDEDYFKDVWQNALLLCRKLIDEFEIDKSNIIDHSEAAKLGLASNHADWSHWIKLHGKTMNDFRNEL